MTTRARGITSAITHISIGHAQRALHLIDDAIIRAKQVTKQQTAKPPASSYVPGCEPDPDHDPFKYRERLGPASPPQTLPQPLEEA